VRVAVEKAYLRVTKRPGALTWILQVDEAHLLTHRLYVSCAA
jgi:hypothetical protein